MSFRVLAGVLVCVAALVGCKNPSLQGDTYSRSSAREVQRVEEGQVLFVRQVQIEGTQGAGSIAGGVLGYAVGSAVGGGRGNKVAKSAGAVAGVAAGSRAEEAATRQQGLEITVQLDSGEVIAIVQGADETFDEGDRVRVLRRPNGEARVIQ
ncbi:MAG: hypothetical protein JRG76_07245 [Deltaproteobacteria bacterium]|nr:hypothetical protein [Deltaproteobacteria bacterium]MBW2414289.1 hypothetical protein [Deltaproteobacteria bacterium]